MCLTENTLLLHHKDETANEVNGRVAVHCKTSMKQCVSTAKDKVIMFNEVVHIITGAWGSVVVKALRY